MTQIEVLEQINTLLAPFIPAMRQITGKDITLKRMEPIMAALGNPEKRLKIIHIAGTSGKTSTAYFIAALLTAAGYKTGLTISPHVDSVLERIQINMQPLDPEAFHAALSQVIALLNNDAIQPTYFEILTGLAYWYFDKSGVEYAVVETGMGGKDDATNIAQNQDKICVITDIGLDHMHVLGNTVEEIARQKAGIIHAGNSVLMYQQSDIIMDQIKARTEQVRADLRVIPDHDMLGSTNLPDYQQRNLHLACQVYACIAERDGLQPLTDEAIQAAASVAIPGRMEMREVRGKRIILDGAHNEQKMQAIVGSFRAFYPQQKVPILLSLKLGKEFSAVLPLLKPITSKLIVTEFTHNQDTPIESIQADELAQAAKVFGIPDVAIEPDAAKAYEILLSEPGDVAIITGSFYLIGQLRSQFSELK